MEECQSIDSKVISLEDLNNLVTEGTEGTEDINEVKYTNPSLIVISTFATNLFNIIIEWLQNYEKIPTDKVAGKFGYGWCKDMLDVNKHPRFNLLHVAIGLGQTQTAKRLLARDDIDVNALDSSGKSPLFWAMLTQNREVEILLSDKGATLRIGEDIDHPKLIKSILIKILDKKLETP